MFEEKFYLVVSSSEEDNCHCEIDAESGPPETQARESSPTSSIIEDVPLSSCQTIVLRDKSSPGRLLWYKTDEHCMSFRILFVRLQVVLYGTNIPYQFSRIF